MDCKVQTFWVLSWYASFGKCKIYSDEEDSNLLAVMHVGYIMRFQENQCILQPRG